MAELHPQLAQDCLQLGRFPLCRLLLMDDANYPWLILVPDREGVTEIYHLETVDQRLLMEESCLLAQCLAVNWQAHKLNIAALGNVVPQLHIHHIARFRHDPAWPAPVWGKVPPKPYTEASRTETVDRLKQALDGRCEFFV